MAYIDRYGPGDGDGDGDDGLGEPPDEPVDYNRAVAIAVVVAAAVILVASVIASSARDTTPWTSGSVTLGLAAGAVVLASAFAYRSVRSAGASVAEAGLALLTVVLAAPLLAAAGYVVLAIAGVEQ